MSTWWGLVLGAGLLLIWQAIWPAPAPQRPRRNGWKDKTQDALVLAGAPHVTPWGLVAVALGIGGVVAVVGAGATGSPVIGLTFGVIASRTPFALVRSRANKQHTSRRDMWPDAVDHLASGIRAGLSLPEALGQLGERGPEQLREPFARFAEDYRASGRFFDCLDVLKARLADPVADRIIEAVRITREVGGTDVGRLLRTLSQFLRDEAHIRGELEARQSWTVNAARLAVAAPWLVLAFLSTRPLNAAAYNSASGVTVLMLGAGCTVLAYRLMIRLGRLPEEKRVLR